MRKILFALAVLLALHTAAPAQPYSDPNAFSRTPGTHVGVIGGIPNTRAIGINLAMPPYSADTTGATDISSVLASAVAAAAPNTKIYLPTGQYRLNTGVTIQNRDNITICGDGDSTVIDLRSGNHAFFVGGDAQGTAVSISGSPAAGDTSFTVSSAANFTTGELMRIYLANGSSTTEPVLHVSGNANLQGQTVRITNKSGNVLTFFPALIFALPSGRSPMAQPMDNFGEGVGIEDLKIDGTNHTGGYTIVLEQTYNCWIKNVTSYNSNSYHLFLWYGVNNEVRHCRVDNSRTHVANGSGLLTYYHSGGLIEDNIFTRVFPAYEGNKGSSGNVIAFNLGIRSGYGDPTPSLQGASFMVSHDPHVSYDLFEGNVGDTFATDNYFGSCSHITFFRNWGRGYSQDTSSLIVANRVNRFARYMEYVGNIWGSTGVTYTNVDPTTSNPSGSQIYLKGFPNSGNNVFTSTAELSQGDPWADYGSAAGPNGFQERDLDVVRFSTFLGNYNTKDGAIPAGEALGSTTLPNSLFRSSKPSWFGNLAWPAFDPVSPPSDLSTNNSTNAMSRIPAGYRYVNGTEPPPDGGGGPPPASPARSSSRRLLMQ